MVPPPVAVVVPTHQRADLLAVSLPILLDDPATAELILVEDGRDPATRGLVRRLRDPRRRHLHLDEEHAEPAGRGGAGRERGVDAAAAPLILALDDDVIPSRWLVAAHARGHEFEEGLVLVGDMPVVLHGLPPQLRPAARFYARSYATARAEWETLPESVLERLWGGHFSVPREGWLAARALPRVAAGYHADRDLGLRLAAAGLRGRWDPALRAEHHYRRTLRQLQDDAGSAAVGHLRLHRAHPEAVEAPPRTRRAAARAVVAAARMPGLARSIPWLCRCAAVAAARSGAVPVEQAATRLLWRVGFEPALRAAG